MRKTYLMTIDPTRIYKKPSKKELGIISNRATLITGVTSQEIALYSSSPYSHTLLAGIYKGTRSNKNWYCQQVFMQDFDYGVTPEIVINNLLEYGIRTNIIYYTFTHTQEAPRFRTVHFCDEVIYNYSTAQTIRNGLILGNNSDGKCKDAARLFLGGSKSEELDDIPNSIHSLLDYANVQIVAKDNLRTRKLEKKQYFYNISNRDTGISPKINHSQLYEPPTHRIKYLKTLKNNPFDFELAAQKVQIMNDFVNGKELKYLQLFGLVTNLIHVQGGEKFLKKTMTRFNLEQKTNYKQEDFAIIPTVKFTYSEYFPQRLENFSPYPEDYDYTDVIDSVKNPRGVIQVIEPAMKITLQEAEQLLERSFEEVMSANDTSIYILKTQTAIGKTSKLTNLRGVTLGFSTHMLKDQVAKDMRVEHTIVPDLPKFSDKQITNRIKMFYSLGLNEEVYQLLNLIAYLTAGEYSKKDRELARGYLSGINQSYQSPMTVLTTHQRALFDPYLHNTIIFDEDPLKSLICQDSFELSDLVRIEGVTEHKAKVTELIDKIRSAEPGKIIPLNGIQFDNKEINAAISYININSNVIQFFKATAFLKDNQNGNLIHYMVKRELPANKKIIILSATAHTEIYKAIYGDRVKVIDIPVAKTQGEIIQHTQHGYSRGYLKTANLENLLSEIGDKPVITFERYKHLFPTAEKDIHFGKCEGFNFLTGKDIAVIGTPHQNEINYLLTGYASEIDVTQINTQLQELKVDRNGFRFRFMTYEDERMQEIQLSLIEAELIQAIGRARSLRTNASVHVYSNLPLSETTYFDGTSIKK